MSETATTRRTFLFSLLAAAGGYLAGWLTQGPTNPEACTDTTDLGALYHQWSKPGFSFLWPSAGRWGQQPASVKRYAGALSIPLPDPAGFEGPSFGEALERRRSVRDYTASSLSRQELSRLLYAAQGVTSDQGLRAAPSAGALYPIEVYAVVHDVEGLVPGVYHYAATDHVLEQVEAGDQRSAMVVAGLGQGHLGQAGVCFILTAIFQRSRWKYRERTYRYVLLEAGHIGQNLYLAATAMGLGACAVGAFTDDLLNDLLGVDGQEEGALYIVAVGTT